MKRVLHTLEESQIIIESDWHKFVHEMYGSLRDSDLRRWEQGEYEEREPLE